MDPSNDPGRIGEGLIQGMIRGEIPLNITTGEDILLEEEISSYLNPSGDVLEENLMYQGEDQMDEGQTITTIMMAPRQDPTRYIYIYICKVSCYLYSLTDL